MSDIDEIDKCNRELLPENYSKLFYTLFFRSPSSNFVVVDRTTGSLLGYVLSKAEIKRYIQSDKTVVETTEGHIYSLAVRENYRRNGYASALMNVAEQDLCRRYPSLKRITLHARESNVVARSLYRNRNYIRCKIVKNYYGNENGILMSKSIM